MIYPKQCKVNQAWQYVTQWGCEDEFQNWQEQALTNEQIELFIDIAKVLKIIEVKLYMLIWGS